MPPSSQWIVTTSPERPVAEVASELARTGLSVEQVLDDIGCIIGRGSPALVPRLKAVRGVADVSRGTDIDIGPPGSDKTW